MANKLILIVDDSDAWRQLATRAFQNAGFSVLSAESGEAALKLLRQHRDIDAVLIDVRMPGMDGFELAEVIREDKEIPTVPRVLITSATKASEWEIIKPLAVGAFDMLDKGDGFESIIGATKLAIEATHAVKHGQTKEKRP